MSLARYLFGRIADQMFEKLSDMKMVKAPWFVDNYTFLKFMAIAERAKNGQPLGEPLGSTLDFKDFQELMFLPTMFPTPDGTDIDTQVVIGKQANKPLTLPVPFMIAGMAYGASVSKRVKITVARAAAALGTATNSGESGFLTEEKEIAGLYVVQLNRAYWGNDPEQLKQANMIEIRIGQGASAGDGYSIKSSRITGELKRHLKLEEGQDAVMPTRFPDINNADDLKRKIDELRELTDGVPIAAKIGAGNIEDDIDALLYAGVDAITIDGAQGETSYSPEITINNFGIPSLMALVRASEHLDKRNARDRISLIMTGGFRDGADMLKAKALGADAFYIGYPIIIAASFSQLNKMPAGSSPTDLYLYEGRHTDLLDVDEASACSTNFLKAIREEMDIAIRCLGKNSFHQICKEDMAALTKEMAEITGVKLAYPIHPIL